MPTTTTYFNPNIRPALIQALESAENELIIAVCWFNDTTLLDVLIQALTAKPELKIKIAVSEEPDNISLDALIDAAPEQVNFYPIPVGENFPTFCIIDKKIVLAGAFNWSVNKISELLSITQGRGVSTSVKSFTVQFKQIIQNSEKALSKNLAKLNTVTAEAQKLVSTQATLIETYIKKYKRFPTQEFITQIFTSGETALSIFTDNLPVVADNALVVEAEEEEEEERILMPEEIYKTPEKREKWWNSLSEYGRRCLNWQVLKVDSIHYQNDNAILNIFHKTSFSMYTAMNKEQCNDFSFLNELKRLERINMERHEPASGLSTLGVENLPFLSHISVSNYFLNLNFDKKRLAEFGLKFTYSYSSYNDNYYNCCFVK